MKKENKWLYPVVYLLFVIIAFLPLYAEMPYGPQDTQDVILNLLMVSIDPYKHLGPMFHLATFLIVALIAVYEERMGRILAAYMGVNYLVIAFAQAMGTTEKYGFVVHTGALVASLVLGITWLVVAVRGTLKPSYRDVPPLRYLLLPQRCRATLLQPGTADHIPGLRPYFLLHHASVLISFGSVLS
jgi:hypothetical protein